MSVSKAHIVAEIRRLAGINGKPPGMQVFESQTGIKRSEWYPNVWLRWGDALLEAGFMPNLMSEARSDVVLVEQYARLAQRLSRLPVQGEIIRESRSNPTFPSDHSYRRFGGKAKLLNAVAEFCRANVGFEDVLAYCESGQSRKPDPEKRTDSGKFAVGYVYLFRHGSRREYKIGRTNNPMRREGEIGIELPQKIEPIHVIETDDPAEVR